MNLLYSRFEGKKNKQEKATSDEKFSAAVKFTGFYKKCSRQFKLRFTSLNSQFGISEKRISH
jgi:hypothetical protein